MNVKDYIESGVLEGYALGLLSEDEQREVEQNAAQYPAVKQALKDQQETISQFSSGYAVTPPPHLRDQVLKAAISERSGSTEASGKPESTQKGGTKPWAIAATILLLVSGGMNFMQYQNVAEMRSQLNQTEFRLAEMESENQVMAAQFQELQSDFSVLRDPSTTQFVMRGVKGRDDSYRADIFWNAQSKTVFLDVKNLPPAPSGKDYQLWALKDGKPIDMGIFKSGFDPADLQEVGQVPGADAFAVTLEPQGGSANPTLEEMYVYGEPVKV